jgi:cytochrome oxidase Cu insertion factor (SCO1/SenC/PrrC family)/mono/diheme cytochrome c family protein
MRRVLLASIAVLAALLVSIPDPSQAQSRPWSEGYFPNLPVITHGGKTVRFYDDLIKGKIVVISFIFTRCTDMCPITTARLAQIEEKLGDSVGRDIFIYSITVDPEHDSPEQLKKYAEAFHAGPGWNFLTGKLADIKTINGKLGERMRSLSEHRNEIVLGNDATGEWARDNVLGDIDRVVMSIRAMDPKWRDQVRAVPHNEASNTGLALGNQPGQAMFKKICAPCHTIGVGDRVGPDLRGITARRERTWLASYIQNPGKMRAQKDPLALALAAKYPVRMPAMGIAEQDAADLISYVEDMTSRLADSNAASDRPHEQHQHHHH